MFDVLIASRADRLGGRAWWSAVLVVVLHGGLIAVAVWATRREAVARLALIEHPLPPFDKPVRESSRTASPAGPLRAPAIPLIQVPDGLAQPEVDIPSRPWELLPPIGRAPWAGDARGNRPDFGEPILAWLADDKPELLSAPPPAYPARLRQLGVEGRVVVRAVVDTTGRVEGASIIVVAAPHPDFGAPVREALTQALFRPARVNGQAVRVLVEIPFEFRIAR